MSMEAVEGALRLLVQRRKLPMSETELNDLITELRSKISKEEREEVWHVKRIRA